MSTFTKIDPSTLGWVKNEIDETLKQARLALEGFVENPADKSQLRFCITHLHQVVGTLLMVELDGAAIMAREIESLAEAVHDDGARAAPDVLEVLTRAILVLPDYLARLQAGHPDVPLKHLPLLNEMRTARKAEPFSELDFFEPDLSVRPPSAGQPRERLADAEFAAFARSRRASFQTALLGWLRDSNNRDGLRTIATAIEELQRIAGMAALEQMFWVAGALLEGMAEGAIEPTPERKKHLARLDQQIKKIVDGTEKSVLRSSSETVTKAMLYELAQAGDGTPKMKQIKQAFGLEALLGRLAEVDNTDGADQTSPEVLESVARVLAKEIEQAQDVVTSAFESGRTAGDTFVPLRELLNKMRGTLEMMGLPLLQELIEEVSAVSEALSAGRIAKPDIAAMPMAQALVLIESGARDVHGGDVDDWKRKIQQASATLRSLRTAGELPPSVSGIEVSEAGLSDAEYKQLLGVVAAEINVNLSKIEETLEGYAAHRAETQRLEDVSKQLGQIEGAIQVLSLDHVAELTSATRQYVEDIRAGTLHVDDAVLDGLAVAIGTIGAYVDGLRTGRKNLEVLVDAALRELNVAVSGKGAAPVRSSDPLVALRTVLDAWLASPESSDALTAVQEVLADCAGTPTRDPMKTQRILTEIDRLLELVAVDASALSPDIADTLRASCDVLVDLRGDAAPAPSARAAAPPVKRTPTAPVVTRAPAPAPTTPASKPQSPPPLPDDFDEEIMQIFIEDARDVFQNIERELVGWRTDVDNPQALAELRRGFHTLKGSGRMVGAGVIAELAWAVEQMLNHVRDGKMPATPEVVQIVEQTYRLLPALIAQLEGGPAPDADIEALRLHAHDVVERRGAPGPTVAVPTLPKLDGVLLDIFVNEARAHVATIKEVCAACREAAGMGFVTPALARSIHTLQGNARSLAIPAMADACGELEKLTQDLRRQQVPLNTVHIDILDDFATIVGDLIGTVASRSEDAGTLMDRFAKVGRASHAAHATLDAAAEAAAAEPMYDDGAAEIELIAPAMPEVLPEVLDVPTVSSLEARKPMPRPVEPATPVEPMAVDEELLEIFREEATDILNNVEQLLRDWREAPDNMGAMTELKRGLHTLKGGARMAGALEMGDVSHHTESLLMQVENRAVAPAGPLFDLLEETHDVLVSMLRNVEKRQPIVPATALNDRLVAATEGGEIVAHVAPAAETEIVVDMAPVVPVAKVPAAPSPVVVAEVEDATPIEMPDVTPLTAEAGEPAVAETDAPERRGAAERAPGQIRVKTELLNNLVNYAGEVSIARSRMEQQIYGFRDNLAELRRNVTRFREQLRELEIQSESQILYRVESGDTANVDFDPLEFDRFSRLQQLTRSLTESLHDLSTIQLNMGNFVGEAEAVLQQQARLNTDLQEGLMRTRMVEFDTQAARLRHITRLTARELGKRAELDIIGGDVQIDRTVLERMVGPFEHMIRNSLDHGLEAEAARTAAGKPPAGRITLTAAQEGSEIVIRFADDGAGIRLEKIRAKAIERGMMTADANLSDDDVLQFILLSGFSTADAITHVSGRGVGMDVVHSEVKQLGGSMVVDTEPGKGTTFIIRLPLTLSITQALMVYVGDQQFAVPISSVVNIIECPLEQLNKIALGKNPLLKYNDVLYSYMALGTRLGLQPVDRPSKKVPVLLSRAGVRDVAMQVDGLGGTREIVIKPLGPQLLGLKGYSGATIMGDGRVVLIMDLPGLWHADETLMRVEHHPGATPAALPVPAPASVPAKPTPTVRERPIVMVVDDSLTVRKVTGKHLQKRGFDVMVAKDGVDAVEQLRNQVPDLMLVDIEMPRMDGYELTGRVRAETRLQHVPIIMITSRAGAKHRQKAFELGVDMYMSKPYQEDELFRNIDMLLQSGRSSKE